MFQTAGREQNLRGERQECEDGIYRLKNEIKDLKKQHSKLSVEVNPLKDQVTMLEGQVADQTQRVKDATPDKKQVWFFDNFVVFGVCKRFIVLGCGDDQKSSSSGKRLAKVCRGE